MATTSDEVERRFSPRARAHAGAVSLTAAVVVAAVVCSAQWQLHLAGALVAIALAAAYVLLLIGVVRRFAALHRAEAQTAVRAERERIAREIHDGLAQDLATIAVHAQRLEGSLGLGHPLTTAARRALAASREAIVDLSASQAPTTGDAIRTIGHELEARFDIKVTVTDDVDAMWAGDDLQPHAREQAVRIAREAIVNAARHGDARHVNVSLSDVGDSCRLRICDDGSGMEPSVLVANPGFGLRTMRARARELGAELTARRPACGGTVLELSIARPAED